MWKNKLQEYCQKNQFDLPKYDTMSVEDKKWKSYVWFNSKYYEGEVSNTKKDAEKSAAEVVLQDLKPSEKKSLPNRSCILYDAENMGNLIQKITEICDNCDIDFYVNKNHHLSDKYYPGVTNMISQACDRDASDCFLMMTLGSMLKDNLYDYYFICSKDHFANSASKLVECDSMFWDGKFSQIITKMNDFEPFFN